VLRNSGKVVVFDTRIPIQLAFYALVEHGEWIPNLT
jgi:5'-AMP-activated protein kinase regulatory gamma subunit